MQDVSMKKVSGADGDHEEKSADTAVEAPQIELIKDKVDQFSTRNGRRPRILVSHVGSGGQKRTLNQIAALFARRGFDVDIGSIAQTPQGVALMAIENDVHIVCVLCDPDRQAQIEKEMFEALRTNNCDDILVTFFADTHTGGNRRQVTGGRYGSVGMRPATADADINTILDKLTQKN